jgi:hypothetical protein
MSKQSQVLDYIHSSNVESLAPLYFNEETDNYNEHEVVKIPSSWSKLSLVDLIYEIFRWCENYNSTYTECTEDWETQADCFRSSLDIWRHVIYVKPEVTIFQVMSILWDIQEDLSGQFCYEVERRVFKLDAWGEVDTDEEEPDEYGLQFSDWKNIDKEVQPEDYAKVAEEVSEYLESSLFYDKGILSIRSGHGNIKLKNDGTYTLEK